MAKQKRIDGAGRIVIPKHYREDLNINEATPLSITVADGALVIRPKNDRCKLCYAALKRGARIELCDDCIKRAKSIKL